MGGDSSAGSTKIRGAPYNFVYGGGFYSRSGWSYVGSCGIYLSSTQYGNSTGYGLGFTSSYLGTSGYDKTYGLSVRCISAP